MSQKSKSRQKRRARSRHQKSTTSRRIKVPIFLKSILLLLLFFSFFYLIIEKNRGYHWTAHTLLLENLENMKKYKELTSDERLKAKLGFTGSYFEYINKHTPENAIIIMPPDSVYQTGKDPKMLDNYIKTSGWANYFVYPRKLVYEEDKEKYISVYDSAQFVAIIDSWGYDKLEYRVGTKTQYSVLPIKYELLQEMQNQNK